jgi:iron-sulfur cluster repair protein YtfE (RIC family)
METKTAIDETWTVNEVMERYPHAISVFNARGVDSCCGGNYSLGEAAADAGIEIKALMSELALVVGTAVAAS